MSLSLGILGKKSIFVWCVFSGYRRREASLCDASLGWELPSMLE